jgi:hypothetical protein
MAMGYVATIAATVSAPVTVPAIEKFSPADLSSLREELMQSGLDHWQAGDLIGSFLMVRGYGVSSTAARGAASRIESVGCSLKCMQEELEKLALVM